MSANAGPAQLLLADGLSSTPATAYLPEAWSPDARHLLVSQVGPQTAACRTLLFEVETRQLRELPSAQACRLWCYGFWTENSMVLASTVPERGVPVCNGLWQIDLQRNQVTPLIAEHSDSGYNLLMALQPGADGLVRSFIARAQVLPGVGEAQFSRYAPYLIRPDGSLAQQLPSLTFAPAEIAGWSPEGSGFLLRGAFGDVIGRTKTIWVPLNGGAPFEINNPSEFFRWGL